MGGKPRKKKRTLEEKLQLLRGWVKYIDDRNRACLVSGNHGDEARQAAHVAQVIRWALSTIGQNEMPDAILIIRARQLQYYNSYRKAAERIEENLRPKRSELWAVADNLSDVVKVLENRYTS